MVNICSINVSPSRDECKFSSNRICDTKAIGYLPSVTKCHCPNRKLLIINLTKIDNISSQTFNQLMTATELLVCCCLFLNKRINIGIEIIVFKHSSFYQLPQPFTPSSVSYNGHIISYYIIIQFGMLHDCVNICFLVVSRPQTST